MVLYTQRRYTSEILFHLLNGVKQGDGKVTVTRVFSDFRIKPKVSLSLYFSRLCFVCPYVTLTFNLKTNLIDYRSPRNKSPDRTVYVLILTVEMYLIPSSSVLSVFFSLSFHTTYSFWSKLKFGVPKTRSGITFRTNGMVVVVCTDWQHKTYVSTVIKSHIYHRDGSPRM